MTAVDPQRAGLDDRTFAISDPVPESISDPISVIRTGPARGFREIFSAYLALTKPRIIELLLITTIPTMFLAQGGLPPLWLVLATLVGGTLAAGSANTLNMVIDRDIDEIMHRTRSRPLVTGAMTPRAALIFGITLGVLAVAFLATVVNPLSGLLALAAILFYVVVYTMLLKRRTPQNIVWGGAAGCMPVFIGWAAVENSLSWAPVMLFLVVFFWTPPHYWPLSMRFSDDYTAAGVPMLPVVRGDVAVARQIVLYSWLMVGASIALWPIAPTSAFYGVSAIVLGALFLYEAYRLLHEAHAGSSVERLRPMRLFHGSITYLTLLFLAVAIDPFLPF